MEVQKIGGDEESKYVKYACCDIILYASIEEANKSRKCGNTQTKKNIVAHQSENTTKMKISLQASNNVHTPNENVRDACAEDLLIPSGIVRHIKTVRTDQLSVFQIVFVGSISRRH